MKTTNYILSYWRNTNMKRKVLTIIFALTTILIQAQTWTQETYSDASQALHYWLVTPSGTSENLPMIVYLHGGSGKGDDLSQLFEMDGFPQYLRNGKLGEIKAQIIIPQLPANFKAWNQVSQTLRGLILDAAEKVHADRHRIALTGHSMGGTGTWDIALQHPDIFCRIAPACGRIELTEQNLETLSHLPVWAIVGTADRIVSPSYSTEFIAALKERGSDANVTILEGYSHSEVPQIYLDKTVGIIQWLVGEQTTAINPTVSGQHQDSSVYDLQGRRHRRPHRGINIQHGRKYLRNKLPLH